MRTAILIVLPLFIVACKGKERSMDGPSTAEIPASTTPPPSPMPVEPVGVQHGIPADSVYFKMDRTPCFGTCPSFTITVKGNGDTTYEGKRFAPREGTFSGRLSQAQMNELLEHANAAGFFDLQDKYDANVTDLPSTIIRMNADGRSKRVMARVGAPAEFKAFATYAEALFEHVPWAPAAKPE